MASLLDVLCSESATARATFSTMIIAAHPDDETISAGGRLAFVRDPCIVHITDGAPRDMEDAAEAGFTTREAYAWARRKELAAALALVGIGMDRTHSMDVIDQEASLNMAGLARRTSDLIETFAPALVLTHPYEGGHPDHDATAFAVHAARAMLAHRGAPVPELAEFASYHDKDGRMSYFEFLPCQGCAVRTVILTPELQELKRRMIVRFATQQGTIAAFPTELERFRAAPTYDFSAPPHPGTLFYERYHWGMVGDRWRAFAVRALKELDLDGVL